jgi:hypothetical protein
MEMHRELQAGMPALPGRYAGGNECLRITNLLGRRGIMGTDPTTNYVSHIDVKKYLDDNRRYQFEEYDNEVPGRGWLVARHIREL